MHHFYRPARRHFSTLKTCKHQKVTDAGLVALLLSRFVFKVPYASIWWDLLREDGAGLPSYTQAYTRSVRLLSRLEALAHTVDRYTARATQLIVKETPRRAGIEKAVTPHRLRASVATILLDAGMPLDQVQKFLRHKRIATTQIYAQTSARSMGESYVRALGGRQ